jgi:pimeloyl-ACP methyl ester carboxylesterase
MKIVRWLLRILLILIIAVLVIPYLIPTPPLGVEAATLADADGTFIEVDGLSTYVLARGPEDGEPVLLLHGWGASTFTWREQTDVLAEAGFRAIAFDRPPYGLSAKTGENIPYSPSALADFTARVMDKLGIQKATLVGQSQGGGVIGYFAVEYPERVESLVFVSGALRPTDDPAPSGGGASGRVSGALGLPPLVSTLLNIDPFARWARLGIRAFVTPEFSTNILKSAYYDEAFMTPEIAAGYQKQLQVVGWDEALLGQLRGSGFAQDPITAAQISAISVPVMIAWGQDDTWVPLSVGERLHELLPEATYVTYPNVGHLPQEEAAAQFNTDLLAFLGK